MRLIDELKWRELLNNVTDEEVGNALENQKMTFYLGTDPTGDSLHVGHLVVFLTAKRFEKYGHHPILLVGGATGLIGDPKGSGERKMLTLEKSLENGKALYDQVQTLFNCEMVNNYDWTHTIDIITFLRDYGKLFNVNYMCNKETVKARLDSGISYTEFTYQILQALDFEHLYKNKNCVLQIGGQDQWGNITSGIELIRKKHGSEAKAYGITFNLVTKADGTKFGKSESGSVWLDPKKTTPYEFYQFWINTADDEVIKRLKQFTFLTKEEIEAIEVEFNNNPGNRYAQKVLAKEVTVLIHGEDAYNDAIRVSEALFSGDISKLSSTEIETYFKDVNTVSVEDSINILDGLIQLGLASSKREAREFVNGGSVSINGTKVQDLEFVISKENAIDNKFTVIRRGKKKYAILKH